MIKGRTIQTSHSMKGKFSGLAGIKVPAIVAFFGTVITYWNAWVPSYSFDESVSLSLVDRSPGQLFSTLRSIDAVHGLYYFLLQFITHIFGSSPAVARLPSALAIGLSAGVVVLIGRKLSSQRVGVIAAIVLIAIPRANWAATEARPFPFTVLAAVSLTLVLVLAMERNSRLWWLLYGFVAAISTVLYIYSVFVIAAHVLTVLFANWRRLACIIPVAMAGTLVASPVMYYAVQEKGQVSWIPPVGPATWEQIWLQQWFVGSHLAAVVFAVVILAGLLVGLARMWRRRRTQTPHIDNFLALNPIVLALAWAIIPLGGILLVSVLFTPVYAARYLTYTTPALALLVAMAVSSITPKRSFQFLIVLIIVVMSVPAYLNSREPESKQSDYNATAAWLTGKTMPGDAVFFTRPGYPASMRVVMYSDKSAFADLDDVMLRQSPAQLDNYWADEFPFSTMLQRIAGRQRVFVVAAASKVFTSSDVYNKLSSAGYRLINQSSGDFSMIFEFERAQ